MLLLGLLLQLPRLVRGDLLEDLEPALLDVFGGDGALVAHPAEDPVWNLIELEWGRKLCNLAFVHHQHPVVADDGPQTMR